jgi:hypothetical protein
MVKKLLFITYIALLIGVVGIGYASAQQQELAYDDGGSEGFGLAGFVGDACAVVFTPTQYPAKLIQARVYIDVPAAFRLHVYRVNNIASGPSLDIIPGQIALPTVAGWVTVDLSLFNISFNSGEQFAIGVEWLVVGPTVAADESPPIDNRSWYWDQINWNPVGSVIVGFNADLMIRATVQYTPVITTTTTTTRPGPCPTEFIYGEDSDETELLRQYRDDVLMQTPEGRELIKLYYLWGPTIVRAMEDDEEFQEELMEIIDTYLPMIKNELE